MKNKNKFEIPELKLVFFTNDDIITGSGGEGEGFGEIPGDEGQGEWGS